MSAHALAVRPRRWRSWLDDILAELDWQQGRAIRPTRQHERAPAVPWRGLNTGRSDFPMQDEHRSELRGGVIECLAVELVRAPSSAEQAAADGGRS